ncbi:MAG TPA: Clp protease N-terminal domain-containing protein, partial [Oscillatoriaceae cyanobacterium]
VELKQMRLAVEQLSGRGYSLIRAEALVVSPPVRAALARSAQANPLLVEGQDILLALLQEQVGPSVEVLKHFRLVPEAIAATVRELTSKEDEGAAEPIVPTRFNHRLLTLPGRSVLSYAFSAARHFGHTIVGTEQLLTGLLYVKEGLASQVLTYNGVDALEIEAVAARVIGRGSGTVSGLVVLSRWCEEILEAAWAQARRLKHAQVGTGHVLLGLIDLDVSGALYLMDHLDINLAQLREDVLGAFAADAGNPEPALTFEQADDDALLEEA